MGKAQRAHHKAKTIRRRAIMTSSSSKMDPSSLEAIAKATTSSELFAVIVNNIDHLPMAEDVGSYPGFAAGEVLRELYNI